ncbi:MAG: hypothetical protein MR266_01780 [Erysipelotrichaceae bacterium]|nr:hypothetical protein [Erysipelotrichaceae bacterium]
MIIKNNFNLQKEDYLKKEKEGLDKAINKLDERFKNDAVSREKFLKQNEVFAKRQADLKKRIDNLNR